MKKVLFQLVSSYLGISLLVSPVSAIAQPSSGILPPVNCQEERDSDVQMSVSQLQDKARQYVNLKNKEKAAQTLIQVFRNLRRLENPSLKAAILEEILSLESQGMYSRLLADTVTNDPTQKADARTEIIRSFMEAKRFDFAFPVAQAIEDEFAKADTLRDIAVQAADAGQNDLALQQVQAIETKFVDNRNLVLRRVALSYTKAGLYDKAIQVARTLDSRTPDQARTLAAIASQSFKAGQTQRASTIFNQALQSAKIIEYPNSQVEALGAVALEYANAQQLKQASEIISQAIKVAQTIKDTSLQASGLRTISEQLLVAQHYDLALLVAQAMKEPSERSSILQGILQQSMEAGNYTTAYQTITFLQTPEEKSRWLIALARKYNQAGNTTQTSQILKQVLPITRSISDPESKTLVFGNPPDVTVVDDDADRGSFLEAIALEYAKIGQNSQAQQVAQLLENNPTRTRLTQRLACYQRR